MMGIPRLDEIGTIHAKQVYFRWPIFLGLDACVTKLLRWSMNYLTMEVVLLSGLIANVRLYLNWNFNGKIWNKFIAKITRILCELIHSNCILIKSHAVIMCGDLFMGLMKVKVLFYNITNWEHFSQFRNTFTRLWFNERELNSQRTVKRWKSFSCSYWRSCVIKRFLWIQHKTMLVPYNFYRLRMARSILTWINWLKFFKWTVSKIGIWWLFPSSVHTVLESRF